MRSRIFVEADLSRFVACDALIARATRTGGGGGGF